jgi:hypothetical protein
VVILNLLEGRRLDEKLARCARTERISSSIVAY